MDKIIGFADLGNKDDFETSLLEFRLLKSSAIDRLKEESSSNKSIYHDELQNNQSDDSDFFE